MKKISEWLQEHDSHTMYDSLQKKSEFEQETGEAAPSWSTERVSKRFKRDVESRGGYVNAPDCTILTSGYSMADACARKFANFHSDKIGRGFLFRDCIAALERAGK